MASTDFYKAFSQITIAKYRSDLKQLRADFRAPSSTYAIVAQFNNPVAQSVDVVLDGVNSRLFKGEGACIDRSKFQAIWFLSGMGPKRYAFRGQIARPGQLSSYSVPNIPAGDFYIAINNYKGNAEFNFATTIYGDKEPLTFKQKKNVATKAEYNSLAAFGEPSGTQSAVTIPEGMPANPESTNDGVDPNKKKDDDKKDEESDGGDDGNTDDDKKKDDDKKDEESDGGDDKKDKDDTKDESEEEDDVKNIKVNFTTQKITVE